jgi:hypothetical protein
MTEPSTDPANTRMNELINAMHALFAEFNTVGLSLPALTEKGECANCGEYDNLHIEEVGYVRFTQLEYGAPTWREEPFWHATTNGWDDMSEDGQFESVLCMSCFTRHRMPHGITYN